MKNKKNILICLVFFSFTSLHSLDLNDNSREPHPETRLFNYYDISDEANEVYVSISDDNLVTICSKARGNALENAFYTHYRNGEIKAIDGAIKASKEFEILKRHCIEESNRQKEEVKKLINRELTHHIRKPATYKRYYDPEEGRDYWVRIY